MIEFEQELTEASIIKRTSRFTIDVSVDDKKNQCHCPTTGRIGNIDLTGRPCLLSFSDNPLRKTKYTIEAISLNHPKTSDKKWIGINQNAINKYVEFFIKNGKF